MIEVVHFIGYCYAPDYPDITMETWGSPLYLHMDEPGISVGGLFMDVRSEKYGNGWFLLLFSHQWYHKKSLPMCSGRAEGSVKIRKSHVLKMCPPQRYISEILSRLCR